MKITFQLILLIVSLVSLSLGRTQSSDPEREVLQLEKQYESAVNKQDINTLERLLADDFTAISSRAELRDKKTEIDDIRPNADFKLESFKLEDLKIRVYGKIAIATGRSILQTNFRGRSSTSTFRYTRVYEKRGAVWQVIAQQLTRVPA